MLLKTAVLLMTSFPLFSVESADYPDIRQTVAKETPGQGKQYCGPASLTNVVTFFRPKLSPIDVMQTLGSSDYMNVSLKNGTGANGVYRGLRKYFKEQGIDYEIEHKGWRKVTKSIKKDDNYSIEWLKQIQDKKTVALINIGWYKKSGDDLKRVGGHWITAFDYTSDNRVVISDPATRSGKKEKNELMSLEELKEGQLIGKSKGLPRSAEGIYRVTGGLRIKSKMDAGLIDGIILIKIKN